MAPEELSLQEFARSLGIAEIPEAWQKHWKAFSAWRAGGNCPGYSYLLPGIAPGVFDLPRECVKELEAMFAVIRASPPLRDLADLWHYLLYHLPDDNIGGIPDTWPLPDAPVKGQHRLFRLAMMVSGAEHAEANFAAAGISPEIAQATLGYIGRFARDIKERRGVWGLEALGWLRVYVRAGIFRLGRLTFRAAKRPWPFRAYKNRKSGEIITLCEGGSYRNDGLANNTHGIADPDPWTPVLEVAEGKATGCPVSREGAAIRAPISLSLAEWRQVLAPGDDSVEVHIAGGSPLNPEACAESYGHALEFFPEHYPQCKFAAFTCGSWLLDPALPKILAPHSNIVQFQNPYHLLPLPGDEKQAYDLVFGSPTADPFTAPPTTQLRRAIAEYVRGGNRMRSCGGFITWEEAMAIAGARNPHNRKA